MKSTQEQIARGELRSYRLPEKHKKEVNWQITKILDDGFIRLCTSQWNASLLIIPQKPTRQANKKSICKFPKT